MLKNFLVVSCLAGLPVLNEYAKTHITKTNVFKKTISEINKELSKINVTLSETQQKSTQSQSQPNQQEEHLFDLILTPELEKLLSKKAKHKVELIKKLRDQQIQHIKTNAIIMTVNSIGVLMSPTFFYWSTIFYCGVSQISLLNDMYTLRTGKKIINLNFNNIGELYLKASALMLVIFGIKFGLKRLDSVIDTKEIVKRDS